MEKKELTEYELMILREAGRIRGRIRSERMTPARRMEIALKANAASQRVRSAAAAARRAAKEAKEKA